MLEKEHSDNQCSVGRGGKMVEVLKMLKRPAACLIVCPVKCLKCLKCLKCQVDEP